MARGIKRTLTEIKPCERCLKYFPRKRKYSDAQWKSTRWCSRRCGAWNLGLTKSDDPRLVAASERMRVVAKGRPGWSKGLTKHTHPSLAVVSRKVSEAQIGKSINDAQRAALKLGRTWARGRTKENCPSIAKRAAERSVMSRGKPNPAHSKRMIAFYAKNPEKHPNAIVARKTKGKGYTYIEKIVADILTDLGVLFVFNVRIGTKWPDFSIPSHMLIIEADGEYWHQDAEKELLRDEYLQSLGWKVVHFSGKDLVNETDKCRSIIANELERCSGRIVRTRHSAIC